MVMVLWIRKYVFMLSGHQSLRSGKLVTTYETRRCRNPEDKNLKLFKTTSSLNVSFLTCFSYYLN
jgi:hypothetical protein